MADGRKVRKQAKGTDSGILGLSKYLSEKPGITMDDLLTQDGVNQVMQDLLAIRSDLSGLIVITINRDKESRLFTSVDDDVTLAKLVRAQAELVSDGLGLFGDDDDDDDDDLDLSLIHI